MDAYTPTDWGGLFAAELGGAATLTGLIFVAVSINLARILEFAALPRRVLKALMLLVFVLILSTLMLVPGLSAGLLGWELLVLGCLVLGGLVVLEVGTWRLTEPPFRRGLLVLLPISLGSGLCTVIAGASLLSQTGGGLYWLVPAVILGFAAALIDAWVLLIEIVR